MLKLDEFNPFFLIADLKFAILFDILKDPIKKIPWRELHLFPDHRLSDQLLPDRPFPDLNNFSDQIKSKVCCSVSMSAKPTIHPSCHGYPLESIECVRTFNVYTNSNLIKSEFNMKKFILLCIIKFYKNLE